jgi:hypothetical protein
MTNESRPVVAIVVYCGICGYYIIAKDYKTSKERRKSINDHIRTRHNDAKLNLWRAPLNVGTSMNEVYLEEFTPEAAAKSWQAGAKKMGWKGISGLERGIRRP